MIIFRNIVFKLLLFSSASTFLRAQDLLFTQNDVGFKISLNAAVGTHFQRLGINLNFYYVHDQFQANTEARAYVNFKNLGPKGFYPELVLSQGLLFAYGTKDLSKFNYFFSSVSNQTGFDKSVGYSYNLYFNKRKTTQQTGIIALQFGPVSIIGENDLLARQMYDRFRTAAALIQYQYENYIQAAISTVMWTGEMGSKRELDNRRLRFGCYMDTTKSTYGTISHGLLSLQCKYYGVYGQNIQMNAGVDAEQVRNVVQNKFIHDMPFVPKKWIVAKNCHIPMIDDKGEQYLYREEQRIRRPRLYLNAFSNASLFY